MVCPPAGPPGCRRTLSSHECQAPLQARRRTGSGRNPVRHRLARRAARADSPHRGGDRRRTRCAWRRPPSRGPRLPTPRRAAPGRSRHANPVGGSRAVGTQRPRPHGDCRTALLSRPGGDHPSSGWCYLPRRDVVCLGVTTRPVGRRPGLQLDESRLRPAPRCVGVRSTGAGLPGGACSSDRHVELPASLVQRRGMLRGDTLGLASLLLFESGTLALNPLTLRRSSQCRREPLDRVLGLERRRRLWSSPAGHRSTVWLGSGASPRPSGADVR